MKAKIYSISFVFVCLTFFLPMLSYSAVESIGEINAKDNNTGTVIAGSTADLILSLNIDMSQAEPGEEIESIQISIPNGLSIKEKPVKSVMVSDENIPNFTQSVQDNNLIIVTLPELITQFQKKVTIEFTVEASPIPVPQLTFIAGLIAINQRLLIASIKPGNADGRVNNDSFTLKSVSATKPLPPTDLKVQPDPNGENDLILSWSNVDDSGISGYLIYRSDKGDEPIADITGKDQTSYVDKDLEPGNYTYTVRSYKTEALRSDPSNQASGTAPVDKKAPNPPIINQELKVLDKGIEISWELSTSSDVVKYVISRGVSASSATKIGEVDSTKKNYTDTKPPETGSYLYTVKAVDEAGNESEPYTTQTRHVVPGDKPYPNPFTPLSPDPRFKQITFPITMVKGGDGGDFIVRIYDLEGNLVREIEADKGSREIKWDGKSDRGVVNSGIYIYQVTVGNQKPKIGSVIVAK